MRSNIIETNGFDLSAYSGSFRMSTTSKRVMKVLFYGSIAVAGICLIAHALGFPLPDFFSYLLLGTTAGVVEGDKSPPANGSAPPTDGENSDDTDDGDEGDDTDSDETPIKDPKAILAKNRELLAHNAKLKREKVAREKADRIAQEKILRDKEDWKAIAELRERERDEAQAKLTESDQKFVFARKISAFREALGANVVLESKFVHLIPDDEILTNPDTGDIDESSLSKAVKKFRKTYPEVLKKANGSGLPPDAPHDGSEAPVTYEQWLAMSKEDKIKNYKAMKAYDQSKK